MVRGAARLEGFEPGLVPLLWTLESIKKDTRLSSKEMMIETLQLLGLP